MPRINNGKATALLAAVGLAGCVTIISPSQAEEAMPNSQLTTTELIADIYSQNRRIQEILADFSKFDPDQKAQIEQLAEMACVGRPEPACSTDRSNPLVGSNRLSALATQILFETDRDAAIGKLSSVDAARQAHLMRAIRNMMTTVARTDRLDDMLARP